MEKSITFTKNGFTALELLIALGVLSTIGASFMELIISSSKAQKGIEHKGSFFVFSENVRKLLSSQDMCTCNFQGKTFQLGSFTTSTAPASNDLTAISMWADTGCSSATTSIAQVGANSELKGINVDKLYISEATAIPGSNYISATLEITATKSTLPGGAVISLGNQQFASKVPITFLSTAGGAGTARIDSCVDSLALGVPFEKGAGTIAGNTITGLRADTYYQITVNGLTRNAGNGGATLLPVGLRTCGAGSSVLIQTPSNNINWPDGNAPQSASFVILPPPNGCVQGFNDGGNGSTLSLSYFAVASQSIASTAGGITSIAGQNAGNQLNGLDPGRSYMVSISGHTRNQGTGGATLGPTRIRDCSTGAILGSINSQAVNWPDGHAPISSMVIITAPPGGCVQSVLDDGGSGSQGTVLWSSYIKLS